ncbi:thioester dehydrase [Kingella kingae]|uniref:3-hydroxylacyl-(Acyl carrier protein) dehydratase n=2 Tax=Kingella kingae TaxID=504 RepID=F5S7C0_KINKI|nr:hypothetical protein [Kingella kingae]EGK09439.1 3-hydroxylacyl-(acyl carrier protein) dehydratase [Kingella kingae ATCC 23330]MDK4535021.1 thioester dehydrase [Kingella kingae]MDK4541527.1 thioester dehydrase [Kingella kingae]MDK4554063.1 thioester dehydrase [Kingella kingae]UOP02145.1 thioester dehydrase [Kingella kingae]
MLDWERISPAKLLPHSGHMMLLDKIISCDEHSLQAWAHIGAEHILLPLGADALPSYLGAEIMAQGVAAWAGAHHLARGEAVRLGFLLGTRKLMFSQPAIAVGTELLVVVKQSWQDQSGMGVFDCELRHCHTDEVLIHGAMNVFSPSSDADLAVLLNLTAEHG